MSVATPVVLLSQVLTKNIQCKLFSLIRSFTKKDFLANDVILKRANFSCRDSVTGEESPGCGWISTKLRLWSQAPDGLSLLLFVWPCHWLFKITGMFEKAAWALSHLSSKSGFLWFRGSSIWPSFSVTVFYQLINTFLFGYGTPRAWHRFSPSFYIFYSLIYLCGSRNHCIQFTELLPHLYLRNIQYTCCSKPGKS